MKLARASWQALGTSVELVLDDGCELARARGILECQLDELDRACSRFRGDSELTRVNGAAGRTVQVGSVMIDTLDLALRAAELTDGDVDPTVGAALVLAGYDRDIHLLDRLPLAGERGPGTGHHSAASRPVLRATRLSGWRAVELDRSRRTIRVPSGVKLDLGATAKAWAADRAAHAIHKALGCSVLVSLGGDISTAGPAPVEELTWPSEQTGWQIYVTDDHRTGLEAPGQTISIASGGLATSSTTARRWRHHGQTMHHIIDPSSGAPAEEVWRTVSVAASDCVDANIAATAAIVRGRRAPEWLAELGLPARFVDNDGHIETVGGWPSTGETALTELVCA